MNTDLPDLAERTKALDDIGAGLLDNVDIADNHNQNQCKQNNDGNPFHEVILLLMFDSCFFFLLTCFCFWELRL